MTEEPKKIRGRKPLFQEGATPQQELVALLLALGKGPFEIAKKQRLAYETIYKWQQVPYFKDLVEKFKRENLEQIKKAGFDDMEFLTNTMIESEQQPAHRSDGLRARELLAKIRGEFSPDEMNLKIKKELENLSDKELDKLAEEEISLDVSNTKTANSRGNTTP